jgi:nicotinate-nucleotide adenylyltransferase
MNPLEAGASGVADRTTLHLMFGGTFDPVHNGHLRMAVELREAVERQASCQASIHLVPCHVPPHRDLPGATADQRLQMLTAAIDGEPGLEIDRRELERPEPSFSVDTLAQLRDELGSRIPLAMAIGTDSFASIDRWHRWRQLGELAHIVVIERPGYAVDPGTEAGKLLSLRKADSVIELMSAPAGRILPLSLSLLEISATDIRARIATGRSPRYLLPDPVWHYICDHSLYVTQ